jgi:hypothetical protein
VSASSQAARLKRLEAAVPQRAKRLDLKSILFPEQFAFVSSPARTKTAVCSRRAGKTVGIALALLDCCLRKPKSVNVYVTLTRVSAKRIVWGALKEYSREYALGGVPSESELAMRFPNGSVIYLAGANNRDEIEKLRGLPIGIAVLDEAQAFPSYIEGLVDEVIVPSLMDYAGSLILIGTPSPVPTGYFHACSQNPAWEHHAWTVFANPWIETKSGHPHQWHLDAELARRGISASDPIVRREWYGEWVYDADSLVFRFDAASNVYDALPNVARPWEHVIGVDLGFDDSDAIAVLAFSESTPVAYLVDEWVAPKQTITQLTERLTAMVARYSPLSIVVDTGGLGRKIAEEIGSRTGLPLKAAEKTRKHEYIELVNDALRSKRLMVRSESKFAADALLVEWDRDKSTSDKRVVSDRYHSDVADALLYSFRESLHWLHEPQKPAEEAPGSSEWQRREEAAMVEAAEQRLREQREEEEWA